MTAHRIRYETLDAWRGAACLAVVAFHTVVGYVATPEFEVRLRTAGGSAADWAVFAAAQGWLGVPVFFVVSGFCIAAAADSTRTKPRAGRLFFVRRFRRIYPPLWIYLAISATVVALLPQQMMPGPVAGYAEPLPRPQNLLVGQWLGSLTLTESWRYHVVSPGQGYFTGQLWTLCYEEQFYAVVGLIVVFARRWLFPALAAVTALVFVNIIDPTPFLPAGLAGRINSLRHPMIGFFFDGLWLSFAAGVGVYYRLVHATPVMRLAVDGFLLAGLFWALAVSPLGWDYTRTVPGYLAPACSTALVLSQLHRIDRVTASMRLLAPLRFCGRMCYSLYLIHAPVAGVASWCLFSLGLRSSEMVLLVNLPVSVAVSVALSYPFYYWIERRFLNAPLPATIATRETPAPDANPQRCPSPALVA